MIVADAPRRCGCESKVLSLVSGPAASVSAVVREYNIAPGLLFDGRQEFRVAEPPVVRIKPAFLPVERDGHAG